MNRWDKYFLDICNVVSKNSKCLSRKVGAIIVKDRSVISTGYNGPPRGVSHCSERYTKDKHIVEYMKSHNMMYYDKKLCPRQMMGFGSGQGLEYCIAGHGERNALINAARHGIAVKNAILYVNCSVICKDCLIEIINAEISEIVLTSTEGGKRQYDIMSEFITCESKIKIRAYE